MPEDIKPVDSARAREYKTRFVLGWIEKTFHTIADTELGIALRQAEFDRMGAGKSLTDRGKVLMSEIAQGKKQLKDQARYIETGMEYLATIDPALAKWKPADDGIDTSPEKESPIVVPK